MVNALSVGDRVRVSNNSILYPDRVGRILAITPSGTLARVTFEDGGLMADHGGFRWIKVDLLEKVHAGQV